MQERETGLCKEEQEKKGEKRNGERQGFGEQTARIRFVDSYVRKSSSRSGDKTENGCLSLLRSSSREKGVGGGGENGRKPCNSPDVED